MFGNPSIATRIAVGKLAGLGIGLLGFVILPHMLPEADPWLAWGLLLWYTTMGGLIGLAGVIDRHPVFNLALPWWLLPVVLGAWLNFVLVFFAHDAMRRVLETMFAPGPMTSPFWMVAEGALVGLLIGFLAMRFGGHGPATLKDAGQP